MPHDQHGTELAVGDTVMVPCRVKAIHLTEDYCNVDLETKIAMPPDYGHFVPLTLNSRQTIKPLPEAAARLPAPHPEKATALLRYMTADDSQERDAALLEMYAERIRNGTAWSWEIPNTVAQTFSDIFKRAKVAIIASADAVPAPHGCPPEKETL